MVIPFNGITSLSKIRRFGNYGCRFISSTNCARKYFDEIERDIYQNPDVKEFKKWYDQRKDRKVPMSYAQHKMKQVGEKQFKNRIMSFVDDPNYADDSGGGTTSTAMTKKFSRVDVEQVRPVLEQLRKRTVDSKDLTTLCRIPLLCVKDYETSFIFVHECLINWYDSLTLLFDDNIGKGYMIASVLVTLANIDQLIHNDLVRILGWKRIEHLAEYILNDKLNLSKAHVYHQMFHGMSKMYLSYAPQRVKKDDLSVHFRNKLTEVVPNYLNAFNRYYNDNEAVKFDCVQLFYNLWYLNVPKPDDDSIFILKNFLLSEYKNCEEKDKEYLIKTMFNYLYKTHIVMHDYLHLENKLTETDFGSSWCNRLMNIFEMEKNGGRIGSTKFFAHLLKFYLLNVIRYGAETDFERDQRLYFELLESNAKFLTVEEIDQMIQTVLSRPLRAFNIDWDLLLEMLKRYRVTLFKISEV